MKVSLVNFTITPNGLENQMLGTFVVNEMPALEERKSTLVLENAQMRKELQDIETTILNMLSVSKGNILDDKDLIETLARAKKTSAEISTRVKEAEDTEREIDSKREEYRPVAKRASVLFFCISGTLCACYLLVDADPQLRRTWTCGPHVSILVDMVPEFVCRECEEQRTQPGRAGEGQECERPLHVRHIPQRLPIPV